jgi:hypothetical protein
MPWKETCVMDERTKFVGTYRADPLQFIPETRVTLFSEQRDKAAAQTVCFAHRNRSVPKPCFSVEDKTREVQDGSRAAC